MRVFITGASGCIGSNVTKTLVSRGHDVVGLVRNPAKVSSVEKLGARAVQGDLNNDAAYAHCQHAEVIVHCAQEDFYRKRISAGLVEKVANLDKQWTEKLIQAGKGHAHTFVYTSTGLVYGDTDGALVDEDSQPHPFRMSQYKLEMEETAKQAALGHGYQTFVATRPGLVYGEKGLFGEAILTPMLQGKRAHYVGDGRAYVTLVHVDDVGLAYATLIESKPSSSVYNVVDDSPAVVVEYLKYLSDLLRAKESSGVPGFMASLLLGLLADPLKASTKISNRKLKSETAWQPRFPEYKAGLADVVSHINR